MVLRIRGSLKVGIMDFFEIWWMMKLTIYNPSMRWKDLRFTSPISRNEFSPGSAMPASKRCMTFRAGYAKLDHKEFPNGWARDETPVGLLRKNVASADGWLGCCICSGWKEIKQEPGTAGPGNMLGCCLLSFHFLWAIRPVYVNI